MSRCCCSCCRCTFGYETYAEANRGEKGKQSAGGRRYIFLIRGEREAHKNVLEKLKKKKFMPLQLQQQTTAANQGRQAEKKNKMKTSSNSNNNNENSCEYHDKNPFEKIHVRTETCILNGTLEKNCVSF